MRSLYLDININEIKLRRRLKDGSSPEGRFNQSTDKKHLRRRLKGGSSSEGRFQSWFMVTKKPLLFRSGLIYGLLFVYNLPNSCFTSAEITFPSAFPANLLVKTPINFPMS